MTIVEWAGAAQTLSLPILLIGLAVAIVVVGIAIFFVVERRREPSADTPFDVARMGYGQERRQRELALWQGILRRLEIQAKYQNPVSERLQQEIAAAKARIAEAEQPDKKA